jgi:glycosyltransferase involved in cell wall biosynthesis
MESSPSPLVSVILPVYNCASYIQAAVTSVLFQSFSDFEFIIIDDGSTDQTPEILHLLASSDTRIRIITIPNGGHTKALLTGLAVSRGKYIARMDADDLSRPTRFEMQVCFLNENPRCGVVGSAIKIIDPDGDTISHRRYPLTHAEIDSAHLERGACSLAHPGTMIRRSMLDLAGSYRPEFEPAEDFDLWTRLGENGVLANLEDELLCYRLHTKSASVTRSADQVRSVNRAIEEAWSRRDLGSIGMPTVSLPPISDENSVIRGFARMAWDSGYYGTARKHAWRQLKNQPFRAEAWKCLMRCFPGALSKPIDRLAEIVRPRADRSAPPRN